MGLRILLATSQAEEARNLPVNVRELHVQLLPKGRDARGDAITLARLRKAIQAHLELRLRQKGFEAVASHRRSTMRGRVDHAEHEVVPAAAFRGAGELPAVEKPEGIRTQRDVRRHRGQHHRQIELRKAVQHPLRRAVELSLLLTGQHLHEISHRLRQRWCDAEMTVRRLQGEAAMTAGGIIFDHRILAGGTAHAAS